jgi:hypothetical protein
MSGGAYGYPAFGMTREPSRAWYWLLLVPLVGVLIPPIYNHETPTFIGIPFFYWYQLAWVPISVTITWIVYRKTQGH